MKITILMGSPNRRGSTSILADEFKKGAEEAGNADDWTFDALTAHYKTLVRYINFEDRGMILGYGCGSPSMTRSSRYPQAAYELGKSIQ